MWKRKVSMKEQYGTFEHFIKGDEPCHYLGQRYIDGTNLYARREWRGVKDTAYAFVHWMKLWVTMAGLIMRNPVRLAKAFWKYRWLAAYLNTPHMIDKWLDGDRGPVLRADMAACECMIADTVNALWIMLRADRRLGENEWTDKTVVFDYTLPKHIIHGFPGYEGINVPQYAAFMMPLLRKELGCYYVDQAIACGIPGDMCTLPMLETGVAVSNEYPDFGNCWLTTNNPCDANIMDNVSMWRALSNNGAKAVHPFTTPMMYDDPTTKELGVHEIYEAIHFLEEQLGQKFDWDAFKKHIENTNEFNRGSHERWDIYANSDNGAMNPVVQGMFRIYFYQQGGNEYFLKANKKILKIFERCVRNDIKPFDHVRHRALAWSCGSAYNSNVILWMYNCWGILAVINMDSLTGHNLVDTEDEEIMMEDLADWHGRTPMRTHTVGGNRHLMQMWETAEKFNCDMIVMYDDIGCKGMAGAQGLLEEEMRRHSDKYHIMWVPHSLMDCRIVPCSEARKAVNQYMQNVLHEEPIDPSLVDYDDEFGW